MNNMNNMTNTTTPAPLSADDRIAALEKRIEALESQARLHLAMVDELATLKAASRPKPPPPFPQKVDRDDAVILVGALLRPMFAALPLDSRTKALAEAMPADVFDELGPHMAEEVRPQWATVGAYARDHALTWADLTIAA